ncbi:hypothetical protein Tco_0504769 [Tanacetum coccineum]
MEVRKVEESYGVNLIRKQWKCQFWEIRGIPFVHVVAGYMILTKCWGRGRGFRGRDGDIGVRGAYAGRGGSDEIRKNLEHGYMEHIMLEEEERRMAKEKKTNSEKMKKLYNKQWKRKDFLEAR